MRSVTRVVIVPSSLTTHMRNGWLRSLPRDNTDGIVCLSTTIPVA